MIINALRNIELESYDDELEHFKDNVRNKWSDDEDFNTFDDVKDYLESHAFYGFLVKEFLEDRDMNDVTDEQFEEYITAYCKDVVDDIERED